MSDKHESGGSGWAPALLKFIVLAVIIVPMVWHWLFT